MLGNAEIAERTGLSKATVSRLTQTLVASGMLAHDCKARAYRLSTAVLSLAHAFRIGSQVLQLAAPLMREVSATERVNVGLAAADREAMVYLESVRYDRKVSLRSVVAGQRIPIEITSLGHAYLSALDDASRQQLLRAIKAQRKGQWTPIEREIRRSLSRIRADGYCWAAWQPGVVAVATPIVLGGDEVLSLNLSVASDDQADRVARGLSVPLLALKQRLIAAFASRESGG